MKKRLFTFVLLILVSRAVPQAGKSTTKSGCEVENGDFQDSDERVPFVMLRCDPKSVEIKIVDTASELGKGNPYSAFSLREILNKTHAEIVVNAGSTKSFSLPIPAGLLLSGGRLVSEPRFYVKNAGVLCIRGKQVAIEPLTSVQPKGCSDAVQRGPLISQRIDDSDKSQYRRTVAAVDIQGRLIIFVTIKPSTLSAVRSFLYGSRFETKIRSALNLDGDMSSGLIFADNEGVKETVTGNVDGLVASAIVIRGRR